MKLLNFLAFSTLIIGSQAVICGTLSQHDNQTGIKFSIYGDNSWLGWLFNDQFSSIIVEPFKKVTLYEHENYEGKSWTIVGPAKIDRFVERGWNDIISSFKCSECNGCKCTDCNECEPKYKYIDHANHYLFSLNKHPTSVNHPNAVIRGSKSNYLVPVVANQDEKECKKLCDNEDWCIGVEYKTNDHSFWRMTEFAYYQKRDCVLQYKESENLKLLTIPEPWGLMFYKKTENLECGWL